MIPCRSHRPGPLDRLRGRPYTARIAANIRPDLEERIAMSKGFLTSHGAIVAALSLSLVGCGQFSRLKASKHFKDANALYAQQDYRGAAVEYKSAVEADPSLDKAYFFLGNSYDNLYKPARKGNPLNDSYLQDALKNYKFAAERLTEPDEETK